MKVTVHRWPILEDSRGVFKKRTIRRTKAPLSSMVADADIGARGICHIRFPGLQGLWDFRISTGMPTGDTIADYVIDKASLKLLQEEKKHLDCQAKQKKFREQAA